MNLPYVMAFLLNENLPSGAVPSPTSIVPTRDKGMTPVFLWPTMGARDTLPGRRNALIREGTGDLPPLERWPVGIFSLGSIYIAAIV
jgi:hypothetical protein